jgi:periplasmic divalent cation tolerance protein
MRDRRMPTPARTRVSIVVLVTCPSQAVGKAIARALVEERLAACVNLIPRVTSIYRWEGKLTVGAEVLLIIKSRRARFPALARRVTALHPYAVPEIIALPIQAGSRPYLAWLSESTR